MPNGFLSGSLIDSPGVYVECFGDTGIYYYRSDNILDMMGAVVVVPEPSVCVNHHIFLESMIFDFMLLHFLFKIQVIHITEKGINPDPLVIHVNDVVLWCFAKSQSYDLIQIKSEEDLTNYPDLSKEIVPRRYLSKSFKEAGVFHYASLAFDATIDPTRKSVEDQAIDVIN